MADSENAKKAKRKTRRIGSSGIAAKSNVGLRSGKKDKTFVNLSMKESLRDTKRLQRLNLVLKRGPEMPRNSSVLASTRESTKIRQLYLNPVDARPIIEVHPSGKNFASSKGLSMDFLNKFQKDLMKGSQFPDVQLFTYRKDGSTVSWKRNDVTKLTKDGSAIVSYYNGRTTNEERSYKVKDLVEKGRDKWTIGDIINYCIYPITMELEEAHEKEKPLEPLTYMNVVDSSSQGHDNVGFYVLADDACTFSEVMNALQEYSKDEMKSPLDTFVYMKMFAFDHRRIRQADNSKSSSKIAESYRNFLKTGLQGLCNSFSQRFVYIGSWTRPKLLKRLFSIWELYNMKARKYKILSNFAEYDKITAEVWDKKDGNLFTMIDTLDPSKLSTKSANVSKVFEEEFTSQEQGLKTVKDILTEDLTRWFTLEIEDNLKLLDADNKDNFNKITEDMYTRVSADLLKAGKFNFWREKYVLSKSYLDDAHNFYLYFEVETYLESVEGINATNIEFERPRHFTKLFMNDILQGLITVRLLIAVVLAKQSRFRDSQTILDKAGKTIDYLTTSKDHKQNLKVELQIALGEVYSMKGENAKAIASYRYAELSWKVDPTKKAEVIQISYKLGELLRLSKKKQEALKVLKRCLDDHVKYLDEHSGREDIMKADIMTEIARVNFLSQDFESARKNFEGAQRIVTTEIGTVNIRAAKLHYFTGNSYAKQGMIEIAIQKYDSAIVTMQKCLGQNCNEVAAIFKAKGGSHRSQAKEEEEEKAKLELYELEEQCLRNALTTIKNIKSPDSFKKKFLDIATYSINLADTLAKMERREEASELYKQAWRIRDRELGPTAGPTTKARNMMLTHQRSQI